MKAYYYGPITGVGYGNITWKPAVPMRCGKFPAPHPCHENPEPTVFSRADQPRSDDPLGRLRARGYLASCFPEGDGISFEPPPGKTHAEVYQDFVDCFSFELEVKRQ